MKTAVHVWNDFNRKLSKLQISPRVRMVIILSGVLIVLLGLMRACTLSTATATPTNYRIARDKTWYPLQLYDKERNMLAFSNELLIAIAQKEHIQVELFLAGPDNLFMGLNNGQFDGVLSSLQPDSNTKELYSFSEPFYRLGPVLIVRDASTAKSLEDMEGKIIGIRTGSSVVFNISQYPEIIIQSYDNILLALVDLDKNVIDGVILDALNAYIYTSGLFAKRLKIVGAPLTEIGLRLITKHNGEALIKHFNDGLNALKADGTYDQLINKWGIFNPELKILQPTPQ